MVKRVLLLPGDGVGPEIMQQAAALLEALRDSHGLTVDMSWGSVGGAGYEEHGDPLPESTLSAAREADAVLLGAVGGPQWESLERALRPEKGLLRLRSELALFANLRPAFLYPQLAQASSLRPELVSGLDIMILRELTGGIYFGEPRQLSTGDGGKRSAVNSMTYDEDEVARIARAAFAVARLRDKRVCSVDKANVLEVSELWRSVVTEVARDYPDITLSHMYVDNAAMQLVRAPKQFDVVVTGNLFGDVLSDIAAMLTGSIGMLPSASLDANGKGMYEPVHGSAPDIAGKDIVNPLAMLLSVSMMLRYSLDEVALAQKVDAAVAMVLDAGVRSRDLAAAGQKASGTQEIGAAVIDALD